jgi:hypothetical protein
MNLRLSINEDYKWKLLSGDINVFDLRSSRQILAQYKILPLENQYLL